MGLGGKTLEEFFHVLVNETVMRQLMSKLVQLRLTGQVAINEQKGHFHKPFFLCQLFNGVAPVSKNALFSIDVRNATVARTGAAIAGIEGNGATGAPQLGNIQADFTLRPDNNRELIFISVEDQLGGIHIQTSNNSGGMRTKPRCRALHFSQALDGRFGYKLHKQGAASFRL